MIPVCFNKFFRLPICLAEQNLIVNTGRSSVSSIQFHSHKLLQSWTLKQPHSFSCPVIYVHQKNELVCVIDKNVVVVWNYEAHSLKDAKEIKFQDTIFAIIPVENQQVVVFNSGSCLLLEDALSKSEFLTQSHLKNEENLIWADASAHESEICVFLLTSCKDGHKLYSFLLKTHHGETEKLGEQIVSRGSLSLQSWCLKLDDVRISFITLWSDGQVHGYNKYGKPSVHLWTIPRVQDRELLAVEALDSCHIVVVRYHPSCGCSYEIWDSKYAVKKTHRSIDVAVSGNLQIRVFDSTLFIPSSQGIVAEPLKVSPPTLASVVGKSSSTEEMQGVVYSWTPDGQVFRIYEEESNDISNCKFRTITKEEVFQEFLSRVDGLDAKVVLSLISEVQFISESKLVKLLQYLLRQYCSEFSEKSGKRKPSSRNSEKKTVQIFLALFLIPYHDVNLQHHLRQLTSTETVATLQILGKLMKKLLKKRVSSNTVLDDYLSTYSRLVNWTCQVIFSHLAEAIIFPEKEMSVVEDVQTAVAKKLTKCPVKDRLIVPHKKLSFERSTSALYCIEMLYL